MSQPVSFNNVDSRIAVQVGNQTVNGGLHNYFSALPVRAETSPSLASTVPFRRDPDFVGRLELDLLHQRLSFPAARVALFGIGGIG